MHSNCSHRQPQKHPNQPTDTGTSPQRKPLQTCKAQKKRPNAHKHRDPKGDGKGQHPPPPLSTLIRYKNITSEECKTKKPPETTPHPGRATSPQNWAAKNHVTVKPL